jgi:hypothetical protein
MELLAGCRLVDRVMQFVGDLGDQAAKAARSQLVAGRWSIGHLCREIVPPRSAEASASREKAELPSARCLAELCQAHSRPG